MSRAARQFLRRDPHRPLPSSRRFLSHGHGTILYDRFDVFGLSPRAARERWSNPGVPDQDNRSVVRGPLVIKELSYLCARTLVVCGSETLVYVGFNLIGFYETSVDWYNARLFNAPIATVEEYETDDDSSHVVKGHTSK